ncbi:copper homeostasis protein CutC [Yeosuana sp. AK3]
MKLEICASNYQSAVNALEARAHRIELCESLEVGGLTPSYSLVKQVLETLQIPVFVLIRPRSGNFTYSQDEFKSMTNDIQWCKNLGCAGIVSGVLNADNMIDMDRTKELVERSKPLAFTFHRAFDCTPNPFEALETLMDLGVDRILTSGQEASAEKGLDLLKKLQENANNKLIILPGSGINYNNAVSFKNSGFKEIHASATTLKQVDELPKISILNHKFFDETKEVISDITHIKGILKAISP